MLAEVLLLLSMTGLVHAGDKGIEINTAGVEAGGLPGEEAPLMLPSADASFGNGELGASDETDEQELDQSLVDSQAACSADNVTVFLNNLENGPGAWTPTNSWALTTTAYPAISPFRSWTHSPFGNYQNNLNSSLFSPVINLTGLSLATLTFWHRFAFNSGDAGRIWVRSTAADGVWIFLQSFRCAIGSGLRRGPASVRAGHE